MPPDDLHFGRSETRFSPYGEGDAAASGCLTSKDEERETWTAESLRVSITRKLRLSKGWGRTKDFGGTRFKGYTIVVRDVNRKQHVGFG
jgi:hypothetical protein